MTEHSTVNYSQYVDLLGVCAWPEHKGGVIQGWTINDTISSC